MGLSQSHQIMNLHSAAKIKDILESIKQVIQFSVVTVPAIVEVLSRSDCSPKDLKIRQNNKPKVEKQIDEMLVVLNHLHSITTLQEKWLGAIEMISHLKNEIKDQKNPSYYDFYQQVIAVQEKIIDVTVKEIGDTFFHDDANASEMMAVLDTLHHIFTDIKKESWYSDVSLETVDQALILLKQAQARKIISADSIHWKKAIEKAERIRECVDGIRNKHWGMLRDLHERVNDVENLILQECMEVLSSLIFHSTKPNVSQSNLLSIQSE